MRVYLRAIERDAQSYRYRYELVWDTLFGPVPTPIETFVEGGLQWPMTLHWARCEECGEVLTGPTPETLDHCPRCCNCYECGEFWE